MRQHISTMNLVVQSANAAHEKCGAAQSAACPLFRESGLGLKPRSGAMAGRRGYHGLLL